MKGQLLKQTLLASTALAVILFILDCVGLYISFSPDQFKLSLLDWSWKLVDLLKDSFLGAIVYLVPIVFGSLFASLINSKLLSNITIFINKVLYLVLGSYFIYLFSINLLFSEFNFNIDAVPLQIKTLSFVLQLYLISIPLIFLLLALLIFKQQQQFYKRKYISSIFLLCLALFALSEIVKPKFAINKISQLQMLVLDIKTSNLKENTKVITDYRESFKSYLGLEAIYEENRHLSRLLVRKTSKKEKELSVILFVVENLTDKDLIKNIDEELYTFTNVVKASDKIDESLFTIKFGLPITRKHVQILDQKNIVTYFKNYFSHYKVSIGDNIENIEESLNRLSFDFVTLKKIDAKNYETINKVINDSQDKSIVVFVSNLNNLRVEQFSSYFTFVSFYIPKSIRPVGYDEKRVFGQEDIMTTLYNMALSERQYISLGDDIFSDSFSNGITQSVYIDQSVYIENQNYTIYNKERKREKEKFIKLRYKSIKEISDFLLLQNQN